MENPVAAETSPDTDAEIVQWIKDNSGLTWQQVARALGVSERTLHFWVSGGRITAGNAELLRKLHTLIAHHTQATPEATRSALLGPDAPGLSPLDQFRFDHFGSSPAITGSTLTPQELLRAGAPETTE